MEKKGKTVTEMKRHKLAYAANAILYCMWCRCVKSGRVMQAVANALVYGVVKLICSKAFYEQAMARKKEEEDEVEDFFFNPTDGFELHSAHRSLSFHLFLYEWGMVFVTTVTFYKIFGVGANILYPIAGNGLVVWILHRSLDKLTVYNDRLSAYFKMFDKEDRQWRRKWSLYTILYRIGGIVCIGICLGIAYLIVTS